LYKFASYMIEEKIGILSKVHLHFDDFITIYEEDHKESYAIIKDIFQHKGNNNKYYTFIIVNWFEDTMVKHSIIFKKYTLFIIVIQKDDNYQIK
ncbi:hypothetical protein GLOIN_2v1491202, partial [Rhizophagus irregularis DAOM 181602=DAOM 197198]